MARAIWDEAAQTYAVTIRDIRNSQLREAIAHVVVSATGTFKTTNYPDIVGRDKFQGVSMHTSEWNHDINLSGKRIGVIGNGRSGVQVVAELSKDPEIQIVQFCR
ncbi:L-lysine 6-monooxygenase (NADPH-requiring) protein [Ceratobasidium sp. AG-Ba]|nr:L-lysine 6-monooxygenase (NADPH-requiring) protein [Ceratobasidium sp. AG-Ba]